MRHGGRLPEGPGLLRRHLLRQEVRAAAALSPLRHTPRMPGTYIQVINSGGDYTQAIFCRAMLYCTTNWDAGVFLTYADRSSFPCTCAEEKKERERERGKRCKLAITLTQQPACTPPSRLLPAQTVRRLVYRIPGANQSFSRTTRLRAGSS